MAYDGWLEWNNGELVNLSRTAQLAEAMGLGVLWTSPSDVQWIQDELGGTDYDDITNAPWYDSGHAASGEFAGVVPLSFPGLDDSTRTSAVTEYITDGGSVGLSRSSTLSIVASVAIIASSDRGAEYGLRWMNRMLSETGGLTFCSGANLRYFRYAAAGSPVAHRRNVKMTRASSVTRKHRSGCAVTWLVTFTLTAGDPFEYGEMIEAFTDLGGTVAGDSVLLSGNLTLTQEDCPAYDYTPIYDPLYPALVAPPSVPEFFPAGWGIEAGEDFDRYWARIEPNEPSSLLVVPFITLTTDVDARMVRVSIWPGVSDTSDQCEPLFSAVVSYLPAGTPFIIDGEQQASYVWDGVSGVPRRSDSLVYSPDAKPVEWASLNDPTNLLVTLDIFSDGSGPEGDGTVRAALGLIPKSD